MIMCQSEGGGGGGGRAAAGACARTGRLALFTRYGAVSLSNGARLAPRTRRLGAAVGARRCNGPHGG